MKNLAAVLWVFVWWACATLVGRADVVNTMFLGGEIEMPSSSEVVLQLDISPVNLAPLTRVPVFTWGDLIRSRGVLEAILKAGVFLQEGNQTIPPDSVEFPGVTNQPGQTPLPKFVPIRLKWSHVSMVQTTLGSASFVSTLHPAGLSSVQFVLQEKMPWWRALVQSIVIGYKHILPFGLDHILFVMGIYLSSRRFKDLLWQVTCFTVAHSITLGLAISGVLIVGPFWGQFVELGIAISIAGVAFENCLWQRPPGVIRLVIVSAFGLVHGLGFAGQLSEVKWPDNFFYLTLFGANVGIELGQLTVVGLASLVTAWWWRKEWYLERVGIPLSFLVGLYGMIVSLDRITKLSNPPKQLINEFWTWYDVYGGWIPLILAILSLVLIWIGYRLLLLAPGMARWLLVEP